MYQARKTRLTEVVESNWATQEEAAAALGVAPALLNHYLTGLKNLGERAALKMEIKAGLARGLLFDPQATNNTAPGPHLRGRIPLISLVAAANLEGKHSFPASNEPELWFAFYREHGPNAYALRVRGDSMWNAGGRPGYHDGDIIVCDPDQRDSAVADDRVIALLADETLSMERRVTFKSLVWEGGESYLKSLNPAYPIIRAEFSVIALVLGGIIE